MRIRTALIAALLLVILGGAIPASAVAGNGAKTAPSVPIGTAQATGDNGESKGEKDGAEKVESWLKTRLAIVGLVIVTLLVLSGAGLIVWTVIQRRNTSLMVEPLGDDAVEAKVGPVLTGLIQKRLADLSERGSRSPGPYRLDLAISADVALLAENESLETALAGLSDSSQFKLVVALLALVDRKIGSHLVAKGELAPAGKDGHGVVLSLQSQKKGIEANGAVWASVLAGPAIPDKSPTPYYGLADRSAAWIQYEAARSLNAAVNLMTDDARSFSLMSEGLARQRRGEPQEAARLYADALAVDPENVAALINLSALLSSKSGNYQRALKLLTFARVALWRRYQAVG
jgi:tetratricopeptide (TPR) repeat protein